MTRLSLFFYRFAHLRGTVLRINRGQLAVTDEKRYSLFLGKNDSVPLQNNDRDGSVTACIRARCWLYAVGPCAFIRPGRGPSES